MYAVFQSGGKQYRVREGQIIRLEKINIPLGSTIEFNEIMLIVINDNSDSEIIHIGDPFVNGGMVKAQVLSHGRNEKVVIIKFRRRKHSRKHQGHRQWFTEVKVNSINIVKVNSINN